MIFSLSFISTIFFTASVVMCGFEPGLAGYWVPALTSIGTLKKFFINMNHYRKIRYL
jgi:hypothetical protein